MEKAPGPCRNWQQTGSCQYGDKCRFSHGGTGPGFGGQGGGGGFRGGQGGGNFRQGGGQGNPGFQGGNQGFNQNQGGFRGKPFNQLKKQSRFDNNQICNYYISGNCQRGDNCNNLHEFSIEWDILGRQFADLQQLAGQKIEVIGMEILASNVEEGQFGILVCTSNILYIQVIPDGNGIPIQALNQGEKFTCLHYLPDARLIFVGYEAKNGMGGVKIFKEANSGDGNFQQIAFGENLHQKSIMAIQTIAIENNVIIVTGSGDEHIMACVVDGQGKFEKVAKGLTKYPIYSMAVVGDAVLCGCSKGKALLLRLSIQDKDFIQEKEYDCDTDTAYIVKIIAADDALYSVSYNATQNGLTGQLSIFTYSNKVSHLINQPLKLAATSIQYIPFEETIFIGYADGTIEFRNKDGFTRKGEGMRNKHKIAIKDIKYVNDIVLAVDEHGIISVWNILDETAAANRQAAYQQKKQQQKAGIMNQPMGGMNQPIGMMNQPTGNMLMNQGMGDMSGNMMSSNMMGGGNMMFK